MGASFRNKGEILALAGCDYLTISPKLLQELADCNDPVEKKLDPEESKEEDIPKVSFDEKEFRWALNEDPCATVKLAVCKLKLNIYISFANLVIFNRKELGFLQKIPLQWNKKFEKDSCPKLLH